MTENNILHQAITALEEGQHARAKDLLTRLLRTDKNNVEYWYWMSAAVDSPQEKALCLNNAIRIDPNFEPAQRGLVLLGEKSPSPLPDPVPPVRRTSRNSVELDIESKTRLQAILASPIALFGGLTAILIILLGVGGIWVANRGTASAQPTPNFRLTATFIVAETLTPTPTESPTPTATPRPTRRSVTSTPDAPPTALSIVLAATYTPTPRYITTEHPESEAYRSGIRAYERGDLERAFDFLEQAATQVPDAPDILYYLGEIERRRGNDFDALRIYNKALDLDEDFGPAYLGRALAQLGRDPEADVLDDFDTALEIDPDFGEVYLARARYLLDTGFPDDALLDLNDAERQLENSVEIPLYRSQAFYQLELYEEAIEQAELALEADITQLLVYRILGEAYLKLGESEKALQSLTTYVQYFPENVELLLFTARAYLDSGDPETALSYVERVIALEENNPQAFYVEGLILLELENPEEALAILNQANRLLRRDFDINIALGRALIDNDESGSAYVQLNETLPLAETEEQQALVYFYRAQALEILDEPLAAIRDWEALLELSEENVSAELREFAEERLEALAEPMPTPTP